MAEGSKKDWERPWTTEEIVKHADNWNLACDAALLNTLKAFEDKFLNKSEEVYRKVENLWDDLENTNLRVDLARNEFNSLRNSQFMECRVYEEDETLLTEQKQENKAENNVPKEETMEDLRESVALGLEILDKYYDKVEVTVSDSEDEDEEIPSYVYRRKDPYINRPLPYVIGSEEWYKKWHVGLQESSDSENEKSASEKFSDSESEDNIQTKNLSDVSSELSNLSAWNNSAGQPVAVSTANTTLHNDFLAPASGSDSSSAHTPKASSFAEQLAAKLGKVIKENEGLLEEPEVNKRPIQKKPSDYGALFTDEPPPVDDSLLKDQEPHGIFSGGKGLFDDDDDDDDNLWSTGKTSIPSTSNINSVVNSKKAPAIRIQSKGLFDDDSDDDIFATTTKTNVKNQIKQPYLQNFKQTAPVFSEEPPLFDEEKNVQIKEKKKPTGGVSVFGNTDIFNTQKIGNILKQKGDDALNESEKDASVQNITKSEPKDTNSRIKESEKIDPKRKTISKVPTPIETRKNSLFEDEDKSFHENANVKTKKKSLFDDDIFGDDLFSNIDTKSSSNLFSDGDLFFVNETATSSKSNMNNSKVAKEKITEKLFEDVEVSPDIKNEYDYSWRKNSKSKIVSLFDDADDDFDIFAPKASDKKLKMVDEEQKPKDSPSKEENTKTTPKVDLFGDDFDDVDDLFSEILRNNSKKASKDLEITKNKQSDSNITKENSIISKKLESQPVESEILEKSAMDLAKEEFSNNSITEEPSGSVMVTKKTAIVSETEEKLDNKLYDDEKGKEEIENEKESDNILGDAVNKSDIFPKEDSPRNESEEASSGNNQPRNSLSVPHVNFLDSVPPPDDGWDNNSDVFDDLEPYSNDGFQSQPSSLFDNEPPSLFFNETSGIMRDHVDQRIDSVNSFDPSLTSSRRLSSDLFSEIQNNDSLFSSKHQGNSSVIGTTQGIPEISDILSEDNTDITPSGNPDDLYSSMSVNVSDKAEILPVISEMNEVSDAEKNSNLTSTEDNEGLQDLERKLVNKPKITEKPKIVKKKPNSEEVLKTDKVASNILQDNEDISPNKVKISNKPPTGKIESDITEISDKKMTVSLFDNTFDKDETDDIFTIDTETRQRYTDNDNSKINENIANEICVDKLEQSESDNIEENVLEESADMQSNIARIAGKLQQVSNKNEEKPRAVPRKLSHKLNINVGALLPGSVPPRRDKGQSPEQEPTTSPLRSSKIKAEPDNHPPSLVSNKPIPILRTVSESDASRKEYKLEKSVSFDSTTDVEVLQSVTKDRAKIPVKRRPSSRRARQDLLRNSVPNFKLSSDSSANEEIPDIKDAAISRNVKLSETLDKDDKQPLQINNSPQINNRNEEKLERLVQVVDEKLETSVTPPISSKENNEKKLDSLFDDERRDQVVDRKQEKIETSENLPIGSKVNIEKKLDSLFDDEDRSVEEVEKLETSGSSTISSRIIIEKKLASLFDDVEDETEDLFKTIEKNVKSVNEAKIISTKKKEDIFSEGEDDFFETLQNTKKNKFTEAIENNFLGTEVKTESPLLFEEGVMDATSIENEDQNISEHNNILYHKEEKLLSKISDITSQEKKKQVLDNLFDSSDDSDDFMKVTKMKSEDSNKKTISIIGKMTEKSSVSLKSSEEKPKGTKNLFDSSDDDDDFLKSLASKKKNSKEHVDTRESISSVKNRESKLFDDDDDEDVFDTSSKVKREIRPSVMSKKTPKSSSLRKLENIEGEEDPLTALLK